MYFKNDKIFQIQQITIKQFFNCFLELGYKEISPETILPQNDKSLYFTNSTTVPLKPYINSNSIVYPGFVLLQPCIRLHNIKMNQLRDDEYSPEYMSYFKMLGVMSCAEYFPNIAFDIWRYLIEILKIPKYDIKILSSDICDDFCYIWNKIDNGPLVDKNSEDESFYRWNYGLQGVFGKGCTFVIQQSDGTFQEIGQLIQIQTEEKIIGYEFGVGVETMLSRIYKLRGPFEASLISQIIPFQDIPAIKKLQDCVSTILVMYRCGANVKRNKGYELDMVKKTLHSLVFLMQEFNFSEKAILCFLQEFEKIEYGNTSDVPLMIISDIQVYKKVRKKKNPLCG